jgi:hypothetical protein
MNQVLHGMSQPIPELLRGTMEVISSGDETRRDEQQRDENEIASTAPASALFLRSRPALILTVHNDWLNQDVRLAARHVAGHWNRGRLPAGGTFHHIATPFLVRFNPLPAMGTFKLHTVSVRAC